MEVRRTSMTVSRAATAVATGEAVQVQAQNEMFDLFNFESDTYNISDEENLQPIGTHNSNNNLWSKDNGIRAMQKVPFSTYKDDEPIFLYIDNNKNGRKRTRSFYDDDNVLFKTFLSEQEKITSKRRKVSSSVNSDDSNVYDGVAPLSLSSSDSNAVGDKNKSSNDTLVQIDRVEQKGEEEKNVGDDGACNIDDSQILKSCNNALLLASQLLSTCRDDASILCDDEGVGDKDEETAREDVSHLYKAIHLAKSLVHETYRERALRRYHFKRKRRKFFRNGRYKNKAKFAKGRPRVKGMFVKMYEKFVPNQN